MELHEAVYRTLNEGGVGLLSAPQRFLAYVMDWVDPEDPLLVVLESNCNAEFMELFAASARNLTPEAMSTAVARATALLVDVRYIHPDIAQQLTSQIAYGICTFAGIVAPEEVRVSIGSSKGSSWQTSGSWGTSGGAQQSSSHAASQRGAGYGAQGNSGYGVQGSGYGAQGSGYGAQGNSGHGPQGSGYGSPGSGYGAQGSAAGSAGSQSWGGSTTTGGAQFYQETSDIMPGPPPVQPQPVRKGRGRTGLIIALAACVVIVGIVAFRFLPRGDSVGGSDGRVNTLASVQEPSAFVGTWTPTSVQVGEADEQNYKTRLRCAQEGDLTLRDDGTFVRSVFPDMMEGSWKQTDGTTAELEPRTEEGMIYTWDVKDLAQPVSVTLDPESESLKVSYGDGASVTYGKEDKSLSPDPFVGLWQVDELVQGGVVQFGKDVFDADRAAGWYTEYLDVRGNGTLIWDRQGDKSEGSWRMTDNAQGVFLVRDVREQGAYWCGIMERDGDQLVFYFGGEGDKETFSEMETDNRSELKVPERK